MTEANFAEQNLHILVVLTLTVTFCCIYTVVLFWLIRSSTKTPSSNLVEDLVI